MDYAKFPKPKDDGKASHLLNKHLPAISLKNQQGNLLNLKRSDTFRLILYFYPMTGNPNKILPQNWNQIPGATGCTSETCTFRDNYEELIKLNAIPIGITTQSVEDIQEMTMMARNREEFVKYYDPDGRMKDEAKKYQEAIRMAKEYGCDWAMEE